MVIGITGSSGAGKSTICEILEIRYNVKVINADKIAKKLSKKGTNYINDIVAKFGTDILDEEGELKRRKLAEIIYNDEAKRQELNDCTFKYIKEEIKKEIKNDKKVYVIDAPLLFECELNEICDKIIGVISRKELQLDRIVARDNIDYESAEKRLRAQEDNEFYIRNCDRIIENNNDLAYIEQEIEKLAKDWNFALTN